MLEINDYQAQVRNFAKYPMEIGPFYCAFGIGEEFGKLDQKIRELLDDPTHQIDKQDSMKVAISLGDILYYIANMATDFGVTMEEICLLNIHKQNMALEKKTKEENQKVTKLNENK